MHRAARHAARCFPLRRRVALGSVCCGKRRPQRRQGGPIACARDRQGVVEGGAQQLAVRGEGQRRDGGGVVREGAEFLAGEVLGRGGEELKDVDALVGAAGSQVALAVEGGGDGGGPDAGSVGGEEEGVMEGGGGRWVDAFALGRCFALCQGFVRLCSHGVWSILRGMRRDRDCEAMEDTLVRTEGDVEGVFSYRCACSG